MAKLDGVKTLDMVNGEITKVAYGGAEYVKTDSPVQEGDIFLLTEGHLVIGGDTGAFYMANKRPSGGVEIPTMYKGNASAVQKNGNGIAFRKVAAATNPSVEERVAKAEGEIDSLKSDVAALKGEAEYKRIDADEAKVGDYVKYIDSDYLDICDYSFTIGKLYEIKALDEDGDFEHEADNGERLMACPDDEELEFYRKVSATSVEAEPKPERLKVGDYAKVVREEFGHLFDTDDIIELIGAGNNPNFIARSLLDGEVWYVAASEVVRATDEEVAEAKDAAARAKFKRGDKVRLKSGGEKFPLSGFSDGGVYTVMNNDFNHSHGKRILIADGTEGFGYATPDQLEILSEEEAAEHKKWTQIGREVGEYKVGDVVAYDLEWFGNSGIGEVVGFDVGTPRVRSVNRRGDKVSMYLDPGKLRLITPVEARFDR